MKKKTKGIALALMMLLLCPNTLFAQNNDNSTFSVHLRHPWTQGLCGYFSYPGQMIHNPDPASCQRKVHTPLRRGVPV